MKMFQKKEETKKTELEKVEERREEVLAAGRKFKYPLQWTKHRVVVNTILIAVAMLAILIVFGWLALYRFQMTDEILYRVTRIVPVSVAAVDEEKVSFADYLMFYRSSILSIERQSGQADSEDSAKELQLQYKRAALTEAEEYTYAIKLGKELNIEVTNEDVANEFERHRKVGGIDRSEEGFLKILEDNFGMSKSEYERMLRLTLTKAKVEAEIDEAANKVATQVEEILASNGGDFEEVADELGDKVKYEETGGLVDSRNVDGGRASEAMQLSEGEMSGKFISMNGDGYYFVKLIAKTNAEVNFVSIKVPFTEFEKRFTTLQEEQKIQEYITFEE